LIDATPIPRIGSVDDIAELVFFLLSDKSSFITGQTIVASGGRVTLP
jgi:NAD(P)-dependent dehydrogenase (short-subunit alcohol dehydrogenase family)